MPQNHFKNFRIYRRETSNDLHSAYAIRNRLKVLKREIFVAIFSHNPSQFWVGDLGSKIFLIFDPDTRQFIVGIIIWLCTLHSNSMIALYTTVYNCSVHTSKVLLTSDVLGSVHNWWPRHDQDSKQEWTDFICMYTRADLDSIKKSLTKISRLGTFRV